MFTLGEPTLKNLLVILLSGLIALRSAFYYCTAQELTIFAGNLLLTQTYCKVWILKENRSVCPSMEWFLSYFVSRIDSFYFTNEKYSSFKRFSSDE